MEDEMNRPERLLYFNSKTRLSKTKIEALFLHYEYPIHFTATIVEGEREFQANIHSTNEEVANLFNPMELLAACFCKGHLEPENSKLTEQLDNLMKDCVYASDINTED